MKNTFSIFLTDLKKLVHSPFALAIVIGLCFLPSLYAWFNIYSNWDPYANTGNIKIGIFSADEGYTLDDGTYKNVGADVLEELATNESIDWVVLSSEKEATDLIEQGKFYACVTIGKDFTRNMYTALDNGFKKPVINYYVNDKKNAVATKITDTAVGSLQQNISEKYIAAIVSTIFETTNDISTEIEEDDHITSIQDKLHKLQDNLVSYNDIVTALIEGNTDLVDELEDTEDEISALIIGIDASATKLEAAQTDFSECETALNSYSVQVKSTLADVSSTLGNISSELRNSTVPNDAQSAVNSASQLTSDVTKLKSQMITLEALVIKDANIPNASEVTTLLKIMEITVTQLLDAISALEQQNALNGNQTAKTLSNTLNTLADSVDSVKVQVDTLLINYTLKLEPQLKSLVSSISDVMENVGNIMDNLSTTLADTNVMLDNVVVTVGETNSTFVQMQDVLQDIIKELDVIIEWMDTTSEGEKIELVTNFLQADPTSYSEFISSPVQIQTENIYGVANYGSGMTPFYTILALWFGGTILVSLIKVHAEPEGLTNVKAHHRFFGRYLMFFIAGQLQAVIVCFGNIHLLGCQVVEPALFYITACFASLTFTLFIYSLAISFGDMGKAFAVIVMVMQIAGSSGTFPIELLPTVYQKLYIFFPFPYAINAMRESVAGIYSTYYVDNMSKLLIFMIASLVIGLFIRVPFIRLNHYVEERMEETHFM